MRTVAAGFRFQLGLMPRNPSNWMILAAMPLQAVVFLSIITYAGREDLVGHAIIAPGVMAIWTMALFISGEIITQDREYGTLEPLIITPARLPLILLGRIGAVTLLSMLAIAESWAVAYFGFGLRPSLPHPEVFVAAVVATALAMAGTATMLSAILVHSRAARVYSNSLSYPLFLLGGVAVPVTLLPAWTQPVTHGVFLSWSTELLRASMTPMPVTSVPLRLMMILLLGGVSLAVGLMLFHVILRRLRSTGSVSAQ
jgi:ABC-2 type transport system permease protein